MNRSLIAGMAVLTALVLISASNPVWAAGKFASPVQNTVTISFDSSTPSSTNFLGIDPVSNSDSFFNWDDNNAGERAAWGSFGGSPNEIHAGIAADAGPNGTGDNAARLYIPSNNGAGSYFANLLWQVKGLQLGNTLGGMITDTVSGDIPVPTDGDSSGSYQGIHVAANFKTDVTNATFRVNIDTGSTGLTKTIDDGEGGTYEWIRGTLPVDLLNMTQSRTGSRVYLVDPGDLAPNTWSSTNSSIVSDLADVDEFGWSNPSFEPFFGKGVRSFNLTRIGVTFPGGGQIGELLVDSITLSGDDVLKYHAADYNYDQMVDDADIDLLFAAIKGADLNDTLSEPPPGIVGAYAFEPVWGVDHILLARQVLTEKFSLTKSDTDIADVLNSADVDNLVQVVLGTQYGDLDLDGDKDATDLATLTANLGLAGGWADGDLNGDGIVNAADLTIFGAIGTAGDYNGDGTVDAADYTVWRNTFGSTTDLRANGDDTGPSSGVIDQADYNFWKARFGNTSGSGAVAAVGAVPEPGTLLLLLLPAAALLGIWRPNVRNNH